MKIKLIDFGVPENHRPFRPHGNDAGADVYMPMTVFCSQARLQRFRLVLELKCRMDMRGMCFHVPVWQ